MCGIFFSCHQADQANNLCSPELLSKLAHFLKRRGPDALEELTFRKNDFFFKFVGSVLHLRGTEIVKQPITDCNNNTLVWNGEIFNYGTDNEDGSDSFYLFNQLNDCHEKLGKSVYEVISNIRGPFALVYWNDYEKSLYFGRDFIGRRSLCWKKVDEPFALSLSSVCPPGLNDWEEVPANGIFRLDFSEKVPILQLTEWSRDAVGMIINHSSALSSPINTALNSIGLEESPNETSIEDDLLSELIQTLSDSIKTRITKFNQLCQICVENSSRICNHSSVAVLFSGGLDSSVIALLSDRYVPHQQSIDLINVAFSSQAQDRLTGFEAFEEIKAIRPERKWNFIQVDVTLETLRTLRDEHIKYLVKPLNTVLDDSIACAVWFAARGEGILESKEYKSPARIVLLGMGADEQLAGYSRHRAVFQSKGWDGLTEVIKNELTRISKRNLGRDDRIVSDHGREARFPYLDETVINFLNSLPTWKKANLKLVRGKGEKLLLRLAARKLGLIKVSGYWKRAIQFGSRIARLENCKEKGSDQCARLTELHDLTFKNITSLD